MKPRIPLEVTAKPGKLHPLKTLQELKAAVETTDVYTLPIPAKCANEVISALRPIVPTELQHLRRLIKPSFLPAHIAASLPPANFSEDQMPLLHLLVSPVSQIPLGELRKVLSKLSPFRPSSSSSSSSPSPLSEEEETGEEKEEIDTLSISILPVPFFPPTSSEQAQEWSQKFWPTVYKRGNPFGPHPAILENAAAGLGDVAGYIAVARQAGREVRDRGYGEACGAVIVDPVRGEIVAVAGDARWKTGENAWGNPLNHAVMRAVSMVAQKRVEVGVEVAGSNLVRGITDVEERYFQVRAGREGNIQLVDGNEDGDFLDEKEGDEGGEGYLCHNMQIYLSHEPCVMCSMALLHSRVGTVVFARRMPRTGALTADAEDAGLGYGLFWRPQLNWKFLCWEWKEEDPEEALDPDLFV
ncbi:hypothetical protein RUND412_009041 [Rhizina undulata]